MLKFAVFVSGGGTDLQSIIDAKNEGKINGEIALVLSNRQKAYGLQRAKDAGIETKCTVAPDVCKNLVTVLPKTLVIYVLFQALLPILQQMGVIPRQLDEKGRLPLI